MKRNKKKASNRRSKHHYFCIFFFTVSCAYTVNNFTKNWKFTPTQEEIQYTFGLIKVDTIGSMATISILPSAKIQDKLTFGCAYSRTSDSQSNECLDASTLKPLQKNVGSVGWYQVKSFLGYSNPYPQMISLEVDNNYIKSYNETKLLNEGYNKGLIYITCVILLLNIIFLLTGLYIIRKID